MNFKLLASKKIYKGRVFEIHEEQWHAPDGNAFTRSTILHPGAVAVAAFHEHGELLLIRQFRPATRQYLLEIPAGTLEPGEKPLACARRELIEETGFAAKRWRKLGAIFTAPGFCSEKIHLYEARELYPAKAEQDDDEYIDLKPMKEEAVRNAIKTGRICDAKTLSALLFLKWF